MIDDIKKIDKSKFEFAQRDSRITDTKFDTKPIGYYKDAWLRFKRNKASVVAAIIIIAMVLFAIIVPIASPYSLEYSDIVYKDRLPKSNVLRYFGIWDGTYRRDLNTVGYQYMLSIGIGAEDKDGSGGDIKYGTESKYAALSGKVKEIDQAGKTYYRVKIDSYLELGFMYQEIDEAKYNELVRFEQETGLNILFPVIDKSKVLFGDATKDANMWYKSDKEGYPLNEQGKRIDISKDTEFIDVYRRDANGNVMYYNTLTHGMREVRVLYANYYMYKFGHEPVFLFGTNHYGQDILVRLAVGIRTSLLLAVFVAVTTFIIGTIIGALQGYYGGAFDLITERIIEILAYLPWMIVHTLFQLHLVVPGKISSFTALLFAFVLTGWMGSASLMRSQFYRFKNQEYVLAAKTLGAGDIRLMYKHVFPNTLGRVVTASALAIPSVIFGESSLAYLGIIQIDGTTTAALGAMLADGREFLSSVPHIIFFPALAISLLMISFNLFGNGLRDAFNPSLRGSE